jgi:copper chaperone NosL
MTAVGVSAIEIRKRRGEPTGTADRSASDIGAPVATTMLALALLTGCGEPEPRALVAGVDGCADCLMVVDADGHGAEIVGTTGKVYTFDSAECMVNHLLTAMPEDAVHSVWVTDFSSPDELVRADEAYYLISATLTSPMGLGLTAFGRAQDRDGAVHAFGGEPADWNDIRKLVAEAWPNGRPPMGHGGHAETMPPPALGG